MRSARRRLGAIATALALACVASGCGVPSETDVVVEGPGRAPGRAPSDEDTSQPPDRAATTDPRQFLKNFLTAPAGAPAEAIARVRKYVVPEVQWKPADNIILVRPSEPIVDQTSVGYDVRLPVTIVGELTDNGIVKPSPPVRETYRFTIGAVGRNAGLFVLSPPPRLLMSAEALDTYYEKRTLYFWSKDRAKNQKTLVPDLRYLSRHIPASQRPTEVIKWLLLGPSPWLEPAVERLPAEATRVGNVPDPAGGRLEVSLLKAADPADPEQVARLATQLRWSLRTGSGPNPELALNLDQVRNVYTGDDFLSSNAAYRSVSDVERFCVYQQQVRRLDIAPPAAPPLPELPAASNTQVRRAALRRDGGRLYAALVRAAPGGRLVLDVGTGSGQRMARLQRTELNARQVGQPAWLPGSPGSGLILADGRLWRFGVDTPRVSLVENAPRGIKVMAVPPDGRRIAYVSNGRLFVAPLVRDETSLTMEAAREVATSLTELAGVAWSQQEWLLVAGRNPDGQVGFFDLTVDGALQTRRGTDHGTATVTHLVALPDDPSDARGAGQAMYVSNGVAYDLFTDRRQLTAANVVGAVQGSLPPGSPEPSPTAPFFLD